MAEWTRSSAIGYPKVWNHFEMLNPTNNQMQLFWIMDVPEHYYGYVTWILSHLTFESTPIELQLALIRDQVSAAERMVSWLKTLEQRLSLMCCTKYPDGSTVIVAVDINSRQSIVDREPVYKGELMKFRSACQKYIYGKRPYYKDFGVYEVMIGLGGFVLSEFSTTIILVEMLNIRRMLCAVTGITLSLGCFEAREDQINMSSAADIAGYGDYVRVPYEELAGIFPKEMKCWIPRCVFFRLMYKRYML